MKTEIFKLRGFIETGIISPDDDRLIREAAGIITSGGLLAFPTETVYGLGGNALMKDAAKKIYAAKGRPSDNPLIVHIAGRDELGKVARDIPAEAGLLAGMFWPGPMTLVLNKTDAIPDETTGGLGTVAVRMPSHPIAQRLIRYAGVPVAAPSANISGRPSTTAGRHCLEDLDGRIDAVLDGGESMIGLESTIIDLTGPEPVLLRPGAITMEMLFDALRSRVLMDAAIEGPLTGDVRPKAPGMKYRHYAPKAPMVLIMPETAGNADREAELNAMSSKILSVIRDKADVYRHISVLCSEECGGRILSAGLELPEGVMISAIGSSSDPEGMKLIASELFDRLRELDAAGVDYIIAEGYPEEGMGLAVMNRLKKASGWNML